LKDKIKKQKNQEKPNIKKQKKTSKKNNLPKHVSLSLSDTIWLSFSNKKKPNMFSFFFFLKGWMTCRLFLFCLKKQQQVMLCCCCLKFECHNDDINF
jgi:hypothetical protein